MSRWLALALLVGVAGCDEPAPPEPRPKKAAPPPAPRAGRARVEDRSEGVDWYLARGVPPLDRVWKSEDFAKAAAVLRTVANLEIQKLPRHQGPSAPLFAKLTDMAPIESAESKGVRRLLELSGYGEPLAAITRLYASRDSKRAIFPAERARITVASLDYVGLLAGPLAGAAPADDPSARQAFEAALAGVRTGVTRTVTDAILALDADDLSDEERRLIAAALHRAIERSHELLPPSAQKPMRDRLDVAASQIADAATKKELAAARDQLTSAAR